MTIQDHFNELGRLKKEEERATLALRDGLLSAQTQARLSQTGVAYENTRIQLALLIAEKLVSDGPPDRDPGAGHLGSGQP